LERILKSKIPVTRSFYKKASKITNLPNLDDFCIEKIKSIEKIKYDDFVYDMAVPKTHNFLIETGFVSSNCDDIGKKLGVGGHMQELRRTRSGVFGEEKLITMQDLADALAELKKGDESVLRKIVLPMETVADSIKSVVIKDSAVGAVCNGAPLAVQGCTRVEEGITNGVWVGCFTLKGELVSIGRAVRDYSSDFKRGMFVKTDRVLLKKGVYPSRWGKK